MKYHPVIPSLRSHASGTVRRSWRTIAAEMLKAPFQRKSAPTGECGSSISQQDPAARLQVGAKDRETLDPAFSAGITSGASVVGRHSDLGFSPATVDVIMRSIYARGDRLMQRFLLFHCVVAFCLAFVYNTWFVTLVVSSAATAMFFISAYLLPRHFLTRCIAGVALQTFCALHIYQMHGQAEMHFFFFTATTMMLAYQDWRAMWPGVLLIIVQHTFFAALTDAGVQLFFFEQPYIGAAKLAFHFSIALFQVVICSYRSA